MADQTETLQTASEYGRQFKTSLMQSQWRTTPHYVFYCSVNTQSTKCYSTKNNWLIQQNTKWRINSMACCN